MKQGNLISVARVSLFVLLATLFISMFSSIQASALSAEDLDFTYSSNGITYGNESAWAENGDQDAAWTKIFTKYKGVIMGISGIATLTMVVLFIINFIKLGQAAGNPSTRSQALSGLLWTGIAAAGAGGVTVFVGIFSSLLAN